MAQNLAPNLSFKHGRWQLTSTDRLAWGGPPSGNGRGPRNTMSLGVPALPRNFQETFPGYTATHRSAGFSTYPRQPEANAVSVAGQDPPPGSLSESGCKLLHILHLPRIAGFRRNRREKRARRSAPKFQEEQPSKTTGSAGETQSRSLSQRPKPVVCIAFREMSAVDAIPCIRSLNSSAFEALSRAVS